MNERIKQLRKSLHITQSEFGEKIGVKGNTITNYENNLRAPSDAVILSICREFNVNETWLRTGEGEMFLELSRSDEIAAYVGSILKDEDAELQKFLIQLMSRIPSDCWDVIEQKARDIISGK